MNIAPYLLARQHGRQSSDLGLNPGFELQLEQNEELLARVSERLPPVRAVDLSDFKSDDAGFVGVFFLDDFDRSRTPLSPWRQESQRDADEVTIRLLKASQLLPLPESRWLMFPDDFSGLPNLTLFCPFFRGPGSFELHSVMFPLDFDDRSFKEIMFGQRPCTLTVSGEYPNRSFECNATGCASQCRFVQRIESNFSHTWDCECS